MEEEISIDPNFFLNEIHPCLEDIIRINFIILSQYPLKINNKSYVAVRNITISTRLKQRS